MLPTKHNVEGLMVPYNPIFVYVRAWSDNEDLSPISSNSIYIH